MLLFFRFDVLRRANGSGQKSKTKIQYLVQELRHKDRILSTQKHRQTANAYGRKTLCA
jgi:hypothetical protein